MVGFSAYTESALEVLRQPEKTMHWYAVPLLLIVMYIVTKELSQKHYNQRLRPGLGHAGRRGKQRVAAHDRLQH